MAWPHIRRRALLSGTVVLAATVAVAPAVTGGEASAGHVSCGDAITADTTLDGDLLGCPNNGIVIGADDITLDLNGHRIEGDGEEFKPCPEDGSCDIGVLNDGHDGVTVRRGSVREFGVGVFVGRARDSRVLGISSSRNVFFGFVVAESARSVVRNSSGNNNILPEGDGMGLFGSHDVRILDSSFRHNPGPGIHVEDSTDNLIKGNLLSGNGPAILMQADRNRVRGNRLDRGGGIVVGPGNRNVIARNRVSRALDSIAIEGGRGNLVARNVVVRARKTGIRLGLTRPPFGGDHNDVRRNVVRQSGDDGFLIAKNDDHSRLTRNIAVAAGDDGFDVESRSTKLTGNRAVRNADLGIDAVRGVIDGGGNRASRNGDERECVNVKCR